MSETEQVEVDWGRILACCNAMIDAGTSVVGLTTPELALAIFLAGMQTYHAAQPNEGRGAVAVAFRDAARHFASEWSADQIPITFPKERGEVG